MNERIRELAVQARLSWCMQNDFDQQNLQEFAELIIAECADVATSISTLFPREDVGFDVGYTMGAKRCTVEINKHFGLTNETV